MSGYRTNAFAAGATVVAVAFSLCLLERWLERRRRHELAWTVALTMFAIASASLLLGASLGWSPSRFRLFYLTGAVLNVPLLALGTVYLLTDRRVADLASAATVVVLAFATGVVVAAPLHGQIDPQVLPRGSEVFAAGPRIAAGVASAGGAVVVLVGALWSAVRAATGRGGKRLVVANVLIASGTIVLGAGGVLNSALGEMDGFAASLVIGIILLFGGFLTATATPRPSAADSHFP